MKDKIKKARANWNERGPLKIDGYSLTVADVDVLELYVEHIEKHGGIAGLMQPRGAIQQILVKNWLI